VGTSAPVILAQASDRDVGFARLNVASVQSDNPKIGRAFEPPSDGSVGRRSRDHGKRAVLETLTAERDLVGIALDVGAGWHLADTTSEH